MGMSFAMVSRTVANDNGTTSIHKAGFAIQDG